MKPSYKSWILIPALPWLIVFGVFDAKAGDILIGPTLNHLSQLDAGCPSECGGDEDSVDHLGLRLLARETINGWEVYGGVSFGRNFNLTSSSNKWNDGGAEIDTLLFIGVQKSVYSW